MMDAASEPRSTGRSPTGAVVWFTGLPSTGKTTLARALQAALAPSRPAEVLDGDEIRRTVSRDLGYGREHRAEQAVRVARLARDRAAAGVVVCVAVIAPYAADRDSARRLVEQRGIPFLLVLVEAPLAVRLARDERGHHQRALAGELPGFTGITDPYETPEAPDLIVATDGESVAQALTRLQAILAATGRPAGA